MRSNAASASAHSFSNTPAAIHSSRRARSVVSDTRHSKIASTLVHDAPVTKRTNSPQKQSRSETLGRQQPKGCDRSRTGSKARTASHTASTTSRSNARIMTSTSTESL